MESACPKHILITTLNCSGNVLRAIRGRQIREKFNKVGGAPSASGCTVGIVNGSQLKTCINWQENVVEIAFHRPTKMQSQS
jgi:hypothetical protein